MTFLPTENRDLVGMSGEEYVRYTLNATCAKPGCAHYAQDPHHLVRRSFLSGDYWWVRMPDEIVIGNVVGLCGPHHKDITENRVRIEYEEGVFYWSEDPEEDSIPLNWQPPLHSGVASPLASTEHVHEQPVQEGQVCGGCGRKMPKPKIETPSEEARPRKTWAIAIPVDKIEDGAAVLDTLLEEARDELDRVGISYGDGNKVKFHILSTSLALFVQHATEILSDS